MMSPRIMWGGEKWGRVGNNVAAMLLTASLHNALINFFGRGTSKVDGELRLRLILNC